MGTSVLVSKAGLYAKPPPEPNEKFFQIHLAFPNRGPNRGPNYGPGEAHYRVGDFAL